MVSLISRGTWGAKAPRASSVDPYLAVSPKARTHIVIHHGASSPGSNSNDAMRILRSYQNTHFNQGMRDIGYHIAVDRWGNLYSGRSINERGAHSYPNTPAFGIVYIGNSNNEFSDAAENAIRKAIAYLESKAGKRLSITIHRNRQSTACPGSRITSRFNLGAFTVRYSTAHITEVQTHLLRLGYDLGLWGADGDLGPVTMAAVRAFQKDAGLTVDALPGPATLSKLKATPTPKPPVEPEEPQEPEVPEEPQEPETPEEPEVPEKPEVPEEPQEPEIPEVPEVPEEPDVPEEPGTPKDPEVPSKPEEPKRPVPWWASVISLGIIGVVGLVVWIVDRVT